MQHSLAARDVSRGKRRVTPLMLGAPDPEQPSWLAFGFGEAEASGERGIVYVTEEFARSTLPAAAIEAMRKAPCFYVAVDSIADAVARTPGRVLGEAHEALGMRKLCVSTAAGLMIFAEQAV
jgi:hypothetical protein